MKQCPTCGAVKDSSEFYKNRGRKDGLDYCCKRCKSIQDKKWYYGHLEQSREDSLKWYFANKDRKRENERKWRKNNPEKMTLIYRKKDKQKYGTLKGRLSRNMSRYIRESLQKGTKSGHHWESIVGYTIDELKKHIEKRFKPGMTWDNYGTYWHIDHKVPVAVFNFDRPDDIDFHLCWSLKNLQPLTATENHSKNCKIDRPFQPSLAIGGHIR